MRIKGPKQTWRRRVVQLVPSGCEISSLKGTSINHLCRQSTPRSSNAPVAHLISYLIIFKKRNTVLYITLMLGWVRLG